MTCEIDDIINWLRESAGTLGKIWEADLTMVEAKNVLYKKIFQNYSIKK